MSCNKNAEIGKNQAQTKMSLKLRNYKSQSNHVFRRPRQEVLSFHHMDQHSWARCSPSRRRQPPEAFSMEGYLRSLGSKLTTTLPETRRAHWIKGIQSISMNLSQCSAETTLRISSWHLSALETILLHPWKVPLDLRTFLKNKILREIFQKTHQIIQQIKVWQGRLKSSTRHCQ